MNIIKKIDFNSKYICLTAYKALLFLKHLLVKSLSKSEISEIFCNDEIISQPVSNEVLRVILNSLKDLGCKFSRPTLSNGYKYELLENPFSLDFNKKEIALINKFQKDPFNNSDWVTILNTNSLINKLCLVIDNKQTKENLKNHLYLSNIDLDLLQHLKKYCENNSRVLFTYLSGKKISDFEMIASYLKFDRGRLYIWGYSPKYEDFSYLRVDKIKSAKLLEKNSSKTFETKYIRYKIYELNYVLSENEILVQKTPEFMIIDYKIENEFRAIQKFLEMGINAEIISPQSFKEDFLNVVKSIKEVYAYD